MRTGYEQIASLIQRIYSMSKTHSPLVSAILLMLYLTLAANTVGEPQEISSAEYATILNLSGKQRMLSQKMSKEMLLIATNVNKQENLENLKKTITLFDKTLAGLEFGDDELQLPPTHSQPILDQLGKVKELWKPYYEMAQTVVDSGRVSKTQMYMIEAKSTPLLDEMNSAVKLYEQEAKSSQLASDPGLAVAINLAGKQRMLTQKMCKEYLLIALGHKEDNTRSNLQETINLFDRTLNGLLDGDESLGLNATTDEQIRKQLNIVKGMWMPFYEIIEKATKPDGEKFVIDDIQILAEQNLPLLAEMNKAVGMYEQLASE